MSDIRTATTEETLAVASFLYKACYALASCSGRASSFIPSSYLVFPQHNPYTVSSHSFSKGAVGTQQELKFKGGKPQCVSSTH